MKKKLKIVVLTLFICVFGYFGVQIYSKIQYKNGVEKNIKTIPKFEYLNTKGGVFTNDNLKNNIPTLFIYYNSECDFCNEETKMIKQNIEKFGDFQLCFISFEKTEQIKKFANKHQLNTYDNIHFLCDSKVTFATTFDIKSMPCLVLYNKNKKLITKIRGQIKVETLIHKLKTE